MSSEMTPHKPQTFVAGVHLNNQADYWVKGKHVGMDMFDNSTSADIHFYRLTAAQDNLEKTPLVEKMLQTVRVYDVWWNNLKKGLGV